jgi:hypothetical protein
LNSVEIKKTKKQKKIMKRFENYLEGKRISFEEIIEEKTDNHKSKKTGLDEKEGNKKNMEEIEEIKEIKNRIQKYIENEQNEEIKEKLKKEIIEKNNFKIKKQNKELGFCTDISKLINFIKKGKKEEVSKINDDLIHSFKDIKNVKEINNINGFINFVVDLSNNVKPINENENDIIMNENEINKNDIIMNENTENEINKKGLDENEKGNDIKKNKRNFEMTLSNSSFRDDEYELFEKYQKQIHHENDTTPKIFTDFLCQTPLKSEKLFPNINNKNEFNLDLGTPKI